MAITGKWHGCHFKNKIKLLCKTQQQKKLVFLNWIIKIYRMIQFETTHKIMPSFINQLADTDKTGMGKFIGVYQQTVFFLRVALTGPRSVVICPITFLVPFGILFAIALHLPWRGTFYHPVVYLSITLSCSTLTRNVMYLF